MATKLKNMQLTSVDLVRSGANQEADICLFKSADPQEAAEQPTPAEANILKRFLNWLREDPQEDVEKDYSSFDRLNTNREANDTLWRYTDAINTSIRSIQDDNDLDKGQKAEKMQESLQQFTEAMTELIGKLAGTDSPALIKSDHGDDSEDLSYLFDGLEKSDDEDEIEEVEKYNHNHDELGRFSSGKGGGGAAGGSAATKFDAKAAEDKLNEIGLRRINGGAQKDDYKVLGETLHSAPVGTVYTETGNRGAKLQYKKTKDGESKRDDEWESEDGYKQSSHLLSMTWGGVSAGSFDFKFDTADTAPTRDEVRDSRTNAVNGQLRQWLGGKSDRYDEIEEITP